MMVTRHDIKGIVILLMVSLCSAFAFNFWSNEGIAFLGQWDKSRGVVFPKEKNTVVDSHREINNLDTMARFVKDRACTIVDVRTKVQFDQGHLPGAVSVPMADYDQMIGDFFVNYPPGLCLIVYCSGRECHDSHRFADRLETLGYTDLRVFSGGFPEWEQGGLTVETR